jgi:hypothetical protein
VVPARFVPWGFNYFKRRRPVVDSDFLVVIGVLLRDEPPEIVCDWHGFGKRGTLGK